MSTDFFIDRLLIAIAFIASYQSGLIVIIALAIKVFFVGLVIKILFINKWQASALLANFLFLGSVTGCFISYFSFMYFPALLSFGIAALLFVITEDLLIVAHEIKDSFTSTLLGFL